MAAPGEFPEHNGMATHEREAREAQAEYLRARARRRAAILAAVAGGASYRKVGQWLGLDHSGVFQIVKREKGEAVGGRARAHRR
jgi:hypothetical protein